MNHRLHRLPLRALAALSILIACATLRAQAPLARAAVSTPYVSAGRIPIGPGVFHDHGTIETTTAGRQAVHIVEVDAGQPSITFEASLSNDRTAGLETTSSQANRKNREGHRAVAAVNGDFWAVGTGDHPLGLHVQESELMADAPFPRPAFGVEADGDLLIATVDVTGTARRPDGATLVIDRVNHGRAGNKITVYTPRYAASTGTDNSGTEVVLTEVSLPLRAAGTYSGTVSQVRPGAGNTPIGAAELVLSGRLEAASFLNGLAPGDTVSLSFSITSDWDDVVSAIGGPNYVVRNGQVSVEPHDPGFADVTHPRTGLGLTADGKVVMVTVDGRQPGHSIGVRLDELGELLISRGVVTGLNLDGGGSTTAAVRLPGYDGLTVVNRPSDGFERAVGNSLLVFSSAPQGPLAYANVEPPQATFFTGSRLAYRVRGQDAAYNAVPIAASEVTWSASGSAGTIDARGAFTAGPAGTGTVVATIQTVTGQAAVSTVDSLGSLQITPDPAIVEPNQTQAFALTGGTATGAPVRIDPGLAAWNVSGPIGSIDSQGVLTASAMGTGFVSASAGGATGSARVDIGRPPVVLEDFEDLSDMVVQIARASATLTPAMRPDPVRSGTRSGRLSYDFTVGPAGTSAAYAAHAPQRPIDARPRAVGVWLYGDGSRHWVRGNYRDANNVQKVLDFTAAAIPTPLSREDCAKRSRGIDWVGWKYLEANIPADVVVPLRWERLYVVETADLCDDASAVYLDDLRAVYTDSGEDLIGPSVSGLLPEPESTVYTSQPEVGGLVVDNPGGTGVAAGSIRLLIDGAQVPADFDAQSGLVRGTPAGPLSDGRHNARLEATDNAGNPALPFGAWSFVVYTGPDLEPPLADRLPPFPLTTSPAGRPRVSARIRDLYRGVDPESLELAVDGAPVSVTWDADAGVAWWAPPTPLANGLHTAVLKAADLEVPPNRIESVWTFSIQALPPPPAGPFRVTWLADGGYFEGTRQNAATAILGEHLAREAQTPPALLLFGGDLVENDQQVNYDRAVAALDGVASPRLVAAGNHEISGSLSRDRFWRTFGPTIAAADLGPSVDVLLVDTASSSLGYDTSQYGWISAELARSDARTVLVALHVPTRDPFGSSHGLPAAEGQRLEAIFAAAKAARPEREIIVLSGDAHAYAGWEQDGVRYVVSGGAGGSPDATPEDGGFYHRLHLEVDGASPTRIHVVPLFESLTADPSSASLLGGDSLALSATGDVFTDSAPDMTLPVQAPVYGVWTSSGPAVRVLHEESGQVEAWVPGQAVITVASGGRTASTEVSVTATLASLRALNTRARDEGGISARNPGLYVALTETLDAAEQNIQALHGYIRLLRSARGKSVDAVWADRLLGNAQYLLAGTDR